MENAGHKMVSLSLWFYCRDGRIKVIGGDGIEGLLISPKQLPYKHIEVSTFSIQLILMFASTFDRFKGEYCCHFDKKENVNLNMNIIKLMLAVCP